MSLFDAIVHEWQTRLSSLAALASLYLFAAALIHGAANGRLERDAHLERIEQHHADVSATMQDWFEAARALADGAAPARVPPWAASPMDVTLASSLPPAPLSDFAIGQSDLLPYAGAITLWDPDVRLFSRYEFEDPVALALGAFDLSKAVVFILPLLLIVLCFDVLSSEREANRLAFTVAHGALPRALVWRRLLIRSAPAVAFAVAVPLAALYFNRGSTSIAERFPWFVTWAICVLLYCGFWFSIIAAVVSRNGRSGANIIALLLVWTAFTLIAPAGVVAVTETLYPTPSRAAYLAEARRLEIETELKEADVTRRFIIDHPDMTISAESEVPSYFRIAYLVTSSVDEATKPTLQAFETAAQRREETLRALRYLSPAILIHDVFNDVAGTSAARQRRYVSAARALKSKYAALAAPYVIAGERLPRELTDALPTFHLEEESWRAVLNRNLRALLFQLAVAGALVAIADWKLRRVAVVQA
jgi:ABC-2 type transport system permease protein